MLARQLEETAAASKDKSNAEVWEKFAESIDAVGSTDIEKSARQVGDDAVDAQLSG